MKSIMIIAIAICLFVPTSVFADEIPSWIKNTAGWWADREIENSDFIEAIKFLIENQILQATTAVVENVSIENGNPVYMLPESGKTTAIGIFGQVGKLLGTTIVLLIEYPDGSIKEIDPVMKPNLSYSYVIPVKDNWLVGEYNVQGRIFNGNVIEIETFVIKDRNEIPEWVRNNAKWWSENTIGDTEFLSGIQFLVNKGVIKLDPTIKPIENVPIVETIEKVPLKSFLAMDWRPSTGEIFSSSYFGDVEENSWRFPEIDGEKVVTAQFAYGKIGTLNSNLIQWTSNMESELYFQALYQSALNDKTFSLTRVYGDDIIACIDAGYEKEAEWYRVCVYDQYVLSIFLAGSSVNVEGSSEYIDLVFEKIAKYHNFTLPTSISKIPDVNLNEISQDHSNNIISQDEWEISGLQCIQTNTGYIEMTGKITNGPNYYDSVYLKLGIENSQGTVVAVGQGMVNNLSPFETKFFEVFEKWSGEYEKCTVYVDDTYRAP